MIIGTRRSCKICWSKHRFAAVLLHVQTNFANAHALCIHALCGLAADLSRDSALVCSSCLLTASKLVQCCEYIVPTNVRFVFYDNVVLLCVHDCRI